MGPPRKVNPMGEDAWTPSRPHAFGPQLREGCPRAAGRRINEAELPSGGSSGSGSKRWESAKKRITRRDACPNPAVFYYSRSRAGDYPRVHLAGWTGIMQADAFAGFNELYEAWWKPAPIIEAACWSHGRREFFDLAKLTKAPIACEAVQRIDELFEIAVNTTSWRRNRWCRRGIATDSRPVRWHVEVSSRQYRRKIRPKNPFGMCEPDTGYAACFKSRVA
jgi:Transposase IS66 family